MFYAVKILKVIQVISTKLLLVHQLKMKGGIVMLVCWNESFGDRGATDVDEIRDVGCAIWGRKS